MSKFISVINRASAHLKFYLSPISKICCLH